MKRTKKLIKRILLILIVYLLIGGVLIFAIPKKVSDEYIKKNNPSNFYSNEIGDDRATILDNPLESGLARLFIIENAKESLQVAYFSIEKGETPNIFLGALFDAADRGVKVDILLDGIFHGLRGSRRPILYAINNHPNMNLKFYEKFNPLMPWTLNNRMHDKYIIADNKMLIMGGRNIGDKYFAPEWYEEEVTNDRDVVVINFGEKGNNSAVDQMSAYFKEIWDHKYSKEISFISKNLFKNKSNETVKSMKEKAALARERYKDQFEQAKNIESIVLPTNKVTLIHNPIERFSKEPWVWYDLLQLSKNAKESVFVQSPYIVPNKKMTKNFLSADDIKEKEVTFLTNSLISTPNLPAYSGYLNYRKKLVDMGINILELQSRDSIHSKSLVIDNELVVIGSFNMDPRSAFLSTESMLVIHSPELVESFGINLLDYTNDSLLVDTNYKYKPNPKVEEIEVPWAKTVIYKVFSKLVKLFDYML